MAQGLLLEFHGVPGRRVGFASRFAGSASSPPPSKRVPMNVKGGRLELLVPHLLRGPLLRPGFVRMSLRLGTARQMPDWAKLQFLNSGVAADDLERVLGRVTSLGTW